MEELAQDMPSLSTDEQIALHFALAKAFADNEDHERSFQRLIEGKSAGCKSGCGGRMSVDDGVDVRAHAVDGHVHGDFTGDITEA